jgi:hypothetical protein
MRGFTVFHILIEVICTRLEDKQFISLDVSQAVKTRLVIRTLLLHNTDINFLAQFWFSEHILYTRKTLTACQQDVFALLIASSWQVWNKLISSCNEVDEAKRLATSCSNKSDIVCTYWSCCQQGRSNLFFEQLVLVLLEQLVASLLPPSSLQQGDN